MHLIAVMSRVLQDGGNRIGDVTVFACIVILNVVFVVVQVTSSL